MALSAPVRAGTTSRSGEAAAGEFRCTGCGYGVAVSGVLPPCPMCRGESWIPARWRPFTRQRVRRIEPAPGFQPPKSSTKASQTR